MHRTYIENLQSHVGEQVTLRGWLYNKRSSGKIRFLVMRDGTGVVQGVLVKANLSEELFNRFDVLTQESSFVMTGLVRQESRAPGGFELDVTDLQVIHVAHDYPITPKEHGVEFLDGSSPSLAPLQPAACRSPGQTRGGEIDPRVL